MKDESDKFEFEAEMLGQRGEWGKVKEFPLFSLPHFLFPVGREACRDTGMREEKGENGRRTAPTAEQ